MTELQITRTETEEVNDRATQVSIPMRDGVALAADVYLPDGVNTAPAILIRLPYDKNSRYVFMDKTAARFTARGYAVVVQDVRGKFRSEGATEAFEHEVEDGYDSIEWVVQQPWSDGAVGMFGDSYYGYTQWAAVASEHPALRAIVPRVTTLDMSTLNGGLGNVGAPVPWLEGYYYLATHWVDRFAYEYELDYGRLPLLDRFEEAFAAIGSRSAAFDERVPSPRGTDPFSAKHPLDARPVPTLQTIGWFDNLVLPQMRDYLDAQARPGWADVQYLEVGAFDHENYLLDLAPIAEADDHGVEAAALEKMLDVYTGTALDFFDVFVRGVRSPESFPKVRWELGHDGWRTADQWPPPGTTTRSFDLVDLAAAAATGGAGGQLTAEANGATEQVEWEHDPAALVPSTVSNSFAFLYDYPDEQELGGRDDVLVFTSAPAVEPLDLAGQSTVALTVSSTAPTTDVFAKLLDVAPDGSARMIVRGQTQLADPSAPTRVTVDLGHTGYRLRPGHALRLHISSSDFPLFLPNPGTEENPWTTVDPKSSRQTLQTSAEQPARLTLTVLDGAA